MFKCLHPLKSSHSIEIMIQKTYMIMKLDGSALFNILELLTSFIKTLDLYILSYKTLTGPKDDSQI